jgi:hypothetical protein
MAEDGGGNRINQPPPEDEDDETAEPKARQEKKSERKALGLVTCETPVPNPNYAWCKGKGEE